MIEKTLVFLIGIKNVQAVDRLIRSMEIDDSMDVIISINNHGSPGDYDMLKGYSFVRVNDTGNIGVAAGWNRGIEEARKTGCKAIVLIPNDGYFQTGAFQRGLKHFYENNPLVIGCYPHNVENIFHSQSVHIDSCIYPISIFDEIGGFDEMFRLCWYEDTDMLMRLEFAGKGIKVYEDCPYYNFPGGNRRIVLHEKILSGEQLLAYRLMNNLYFYLKWKDKLTPDKIKREKEKIKGNMEGLKKAI